jgi:hypothetical protein
MDLSAVTILVVSILSYNRISEFFCGSQLSAYMPPRGVIFPQSLFLTRPRSRVLIEIAKLIFHSYMIRQKWHYFDVDGIGKIEMALSVICHNSKIVKKLTLT